MGNLLSSDLYRFKKKKSNLVLLIILFAIMTLELFGNGFLLGNAPWVIQFSNTVDELTNGGILFSFSDLRAMMFASFDPIRTFSDVIVHSFSNYTMIFMSLFIATFIMQPLRTSYLKNLASEFPRPFFVYSDTVFLAVWCFVVTMINALLAVPFGLAFFKVSGPGNVFELLVWIFIKFLLLFATSLGISLFVTLLKRSSLAITFAILYIAVLGPNFFAIGDFVMGYSDSGFRFSYLTPFGNYEILDTDIVHLLIGMAVALLYAALAFWLRVLLYRKRDIY